MEFWDYIGILCTMLSIFGAAKSNIYYNKSKQLTVYLDTNSAFAESKKIINALTEMLEFARFLKKDEEPGGKRGINYANKMSKNGRFIKDSINEIRATLPKKDSEEIDRILNSRGFEAEKYIDAIIMQLFIHDEELSIETNFSKCESNFKEMQSFIKDNLERLNKKLN